jgi:hypothetical protein
MLLTTSHEGIFASLLIYIAYIISTRGDINGKLEKKF